MRLKRLWAVLLVVGLMLTVFMAKVPSYAGSATASVSGGVITISFTEKIEKILVGGVYDSNTKGFFVYQGQENNFSQFVTWQYSVFGNVVTFNVKGCMDYLRENSTQDSTVSYGLHQISILGFKANSNTASETASASYTYNDPNTEYNYEVIYEDYSYEEGTAKAGQELTFKAYDNYSIDGETYEFDHWEVLSGDYRISDIDWDNKSLTVTMPESDIVIKAVYVEVEPPEGLPFEDVPEDSFYYEPVKWAVNHNPQITAGMDETHFCPNDNCTRGQIVCFLWRAAGCPEPTITTHPFVDVTNPNSFYYKAMLWALENNITAGTDATHFSPKEPCSRGQVVTFLWRMKGCPESSLTENPFVDTNPGAYYYKAMLWAVENNVTSGVNATKFAPKRACSRAQIVTFLYRAEKIPEKLNELGDEFLLYVEDFFSIVSKGNVITGRVRNGRVDVGDTIKIMTFNDSMEPVVLETTVQGIEMFQKTLTYAEKGDYIGILLGDNVPKKQLRVGAAVVHSDSKLQFIPNMVKMVGTLKLDGDSGLEGIDGRHFYMFSDPATGYEAFICNVNGDTHIAMGETRDNVEAFLNGDWPLVWYTGQELIVSVDGVRYGTFTIKGFSPITDDDLI